jgi:hypothetical protein
MQFIAEQYFHAAVERIEDARVLYVGERYSLSIFTSGLAVECLLRAFHWRINPVFDARHDIARLFKTCGFADAERLRLDRRGVEVVKNQSALAEMFGARDTIVRYWSNDYRFMAESQLRAKLRVLGATQSKRGNQVKPCALAVYNAAKLLIDRGAVLWTYVKK